MDNDELMDVQGVFQSIEVELGPQFSWTMLLAHVVYVRRKPIIVEELALPVGVTAACIAFCDVDVIITRTGLSLTRALFARLHECSHLLLGHAPTLPVQYRHCLHESELQLALHRQATTAYDDPREFAAETLATQLAAAVKRNAEQLPVTTQLMYGYGVAK